MLVSYFSNGGVVAVTIIRHDDAPRFHDDGVSVTGLASPSRGCATVSAWRVVLAPGAGSPEHSLTSDEAFVALRGRARVELDGEAQELAAGDCLVVAPDRTFTIRNDGPEPFEAVCCMAAGGRAVVAGEGSFVPPWAA
jgi:mannose-6-phosphate isomerase-like protein (cupin superfamily)